MVTHVTLIEEMNKWLKQASEESICEMIGDMAGRLFANCTSDIQKACVVSMFTDAMEE